MKKKLIVTLVSSFVLASAVNAEHFKFSPIAGSATGDGSDFDINAPWILPEGYKQIRVKDESLLNIYKNDGVQEPTTSANYNDWHDMNTVNETGKHAGRYMFTTHEVRGHSTGGAVSLQDMKSGITRIMTQDVTYDALDGIVWTPWKTVLFAEEKTDGRLFEIMFDPKNPMRSEVVYRPAVGRLAHEGIEADAQGNVYVVDEFRGQKSGYGGGVYKFVPNKKGDLSEGDLYVLAFDEDNHEGLGQAHWAGPIAPQTARLSGTDAGGHGYNRPEDVELIGNTLYVAVTEGPYSGNSQDYDGRVLAVNLDTMMVTNFVKPGVNVPFESSGVTGFDNPDNLARTADGRLVIVEDNVPSDIWFAKDSDNDGVADAVELFASLTDDGAEGSGIYISPSNPHMLFVNIQHSKVDDNDGTWAIYRKSGKKNEHNDHESEEGEQDHGKGRNHHGKGRNHHGKDRNHH